MEPTKKVTRTYAFDSHGPVEQDYTDTTEECLCSVELGETAKGEAQVKSVKVYAATAKEAGAQAIAEFWRIKATMVQWEAGA